MTYKSEAPVLDLDALLDELSETFVSTSPYTLGASFLFLLWGYFHITMKDPNEEDGGAATTSLTVPRIIPVEQGYLILDYGDYLKTSPGENYGTYTTGKLLTTVKAMVALVNQRNAKQVWWFSCLSAVERMAWVECEKYKIKTYFTPGIKEKELLQRLENRHYAANDLKNLI